MERRVLHNKWADHAWEAKALLPEDPENPSATRVFAESAVATQWLFPPLELTLFTDEAENYLLNVTAREPRIFVMWRADDEADPPALQDREEKTAAKRGMAFGKPDSLRFRHRRLLQHRFALAHGIEIDPRPPGAVRADDFELRRRHPIGHRVKCRHQSINPSPFEY